MDLNLIGTKENLGKNGRYFSPFRIGVDDKVLKHLKNILKKESFSKVEEAYSLVKNHKGVMSKRIKQPLYELGFNEYFRGFNSHSGDTIIYQDRRGDWYFSIGLANINQAGRGLEIELEFK